MENYGYLSTSEVLIDGCLKCWLVWTDAEELGVMAAIHARSISSHAETQKLGSGIKDLDAHYRALRRIRRAYQRDVVRNGIASSTFAVSRIS